MPFCPWCPGRFFKDDDAIRMHTESGRHRVAATYNCEECNKKLSSQTALEQHTRDKHPSIECEYCYRTFTTDVGRLAHQKAKHQAMFECRHCYDEFRSEDAREQHEHAKHYFECRFCDKSFTQVGAREQHEQAKHYVECSYCTSKFFTQRSKSAHEKSCSGNPANCTTRSTRSWPRLLLSNASKSTGTVDTESSTSDVTQGTDEGSESPASPSHSSDSALDKGEMFHSTSRSPSTDAPCERATVEPRPCIHSLELCTCPICQRASSQSSDADKPIPDDVENAVSADDKHQDESTDLRSVIFQCTPCLEVFETEEAFQDHVCAFRAAMFRPHCLVCYTQFDDALLLQEHMEGLRSFSCHLCPTRCCSDEILQDHLLSHPTCGKCSKPFADDLSLCAHVASDHPVVVCWDCDGIVVEKDSLELHYADSSAHPSCALCGLGTRNSAEMEEHVRHAHAPSTEMEDNREGGNVNASPDEEPLTEKQPPGVDREGAARQPSEELDCMPPPSVAEVVGPLGGPGDEFHNSPLQTEPSIFLSPQLPTPPQVDEAVVNSCVINGEEPPDMDPRQNASPSPTPSEHGSDASRLQLLASETTNGATNNDTRSLSPASSVSVEPFSDTSTQSSPTSSSDSVVFISADGIPDYIRENRAVLVATSAGSPSSGHTPLRLSSSSSLESLEMVEPVPIPTHAEERAPISDNANAIGTGMGAINVAHRLHCRICLLDPCEDMTATICGHLFCKRCITQAVVAKSECPVCKSATLLYCLFKLDLSV